MLLLDTELARTRLGLSDKDEVTTALGVAIAGVTPRFESILQSCFDNKEYTDYFFVSSSANPAINGMYRLKCSTGFIRRDAAMVIKTAETLVALQSSATEVDQTGVLKQLEKGYVYIPEEYADQYISVSYSAGFDDGEELPSWLTETAFYQMVKLLALNQNAEVKAELANALKMVDDYNVQVLDAHLRTSANAVTPIA